MNRKLSTLLVLLALSGCATLDAAGDVSYLPDAKGNFEAGENALQGGRHLDALKYFDHVRYKFPYSQQAALADLGVADTNFDREKYLEAIDSYRSFLKLHPNHPKADYAQYRIAYSYFKDIPSDFILFPSSTEKDQTSVKDARAAFEEFIKAYPSSPYVPEAKKQLADVLTRLAEHEMRVAEFYLHHDHLKAAVGRFSRLVDDYPHSELAPKALVKLAETYVKLDQKEKARAALERLLKDYPENEHRPQAEALLKSLA
ncbi:MAG: outer membrane protein assembly factor BamD [Deltaproteobacteria bacterium]|nr:outer membrane protein assembly factor BamD [Deltaproteobacteria bacterium]